MDACPLCGSKLEKGFLIIKGDLRWDTKKHRLVESAIAYGAKQLTGHSLFEQNLESYHCPKCKLVLFKY